MRFLYRTCFISLQKPSRFTWVALVLSKILTFLHQWLSFIPPPTAPHRKLQPWCTQSLPQWGISFRQALDKVPSTGVQDVHCPGGHRFYPQLYVWLPPQGYTWWSSLHNNKVSGYLFSRATDSAGQSLHPSPSSPCWRLCLPWLVAEKGLWASPEPRFCPNQYGPALVSSLPPQHLPGLHSFSVNSVGFSFKPSFKKSCLFLQSLVFPDIP